MVVNPKQVVPGFKIQGKEVDESDPVVKMVQTYKKAQETRKKSQQTLIKLIERVNLDRPLMLQEKMNMILREKNQQIRAN